MNTESLFALLAQGSDFQARERHQDQVATPAPTMSLQQLTPQQRRSQLRQVLTQALKIASDVRLDDYEDDFNFFPGGSQPQNDDSMNGSTTSL
jgi:hypothetical protein